MRVSQAVKKRDQLYKAGFIFHSSNKKALFIYTLKDSRLETIYYLVKMN